MRKTARNKFFNFSAILLVAFFSFFGLTKEIRADELVESITVLDETASMEGGLPSLRVFPSSSIKTFENTSVVGTTVKFKFTVSLREGVDGAKITDSNTMVNLGGWENIFEYNETYFQSKEDTDYADGRGFYLDIATNKSALVDQFPLSGSFEDKESFYTSWGALKIENEETESSFLSSGLLGPFDEALSFINQIKNTEILLFGENESEEINDTEISYPISVTVAQVKPDVFDVATQDIDTITIEELTVSGLYPNTTYYAQIRVEENVGDTAFGGLSADAMATQVGISPEIIKFTTGDGPIPSGDPIVLSPTAEGASTVSDSSEWFLANFDCGIHIPGFNSSDVSLLDCIPIGLYNFVYVPSAAILYFSGGMLDSFFSWSISSSVYRDSTFVVDGWRIVRDLSNIGFIIALVYAAISVILQLGGNIRRTVVSVIIIGLLINFSLFFSKVVIDAGNAVAKVFYNQITISGVASDTIIEADVEVKSLSQAIVDGMDLQKIISNQTLDAITNNSYGNRRYADEGLITLMIVMGIILNLTTAWAFFLVSWTFIGRVVGLWLAMISSPLAFLSKVLPQVGRMGGSNFTMGSWFSNLLSLSFLAPIFIFLIYLLILLIDSGFLDKMIVGGL